MTLQAAFGWENCHLFQFGQTEWHDPKNIGIPDDELPVMDAHLWIIGQLFRKPGDRLVYLYDFGDFWVHRIVLEEINHKELYVPVCLGGKNECPPEDVGGVGGYSAMLEAFNSKDTTEKKSYRQWLGLASGENWDPAYFNLREVNKRLALISVEDR